MIPMTMAIRALNAAKIRYVARTYSFVEHGGTAQAASDLGLDHHAVIKTIILEDETRKPFVCLMHGDREISTKQLARIRGVKTVRTCEPTVADRHSGYHVGIDIFAAANLHQRWTPRSDGRDESVRP